MWKCWLQWKQAHVFIDWTLWDTEDMEKLLWRLNMAEFHMDVCGVFFQIFNENASLSPWNTNVQYIVEEHLDKNKKAHTYRSLALCKTAFLRANVEKLLWSWTHCIYLWSTSCFVSHISYTVGRSVAGVGSQEYGRSKRSMFLLKMTENSLESSWWRLMPSWLYTHRSPVQS